MPRSVRGWRVSAPSSGEVRRVQDRGRRARADPGREKTELQKLTDQLAAVTAERCGATVLVGAPFGGGQRGVPASALAGATREELEAAADALIAWRRAG